MRRSDLFLFEKMRKSCGRHEANMQYAVVSPPSLNNDPIGQDYKVKVKGDASRSVPQL